MIFSIALDGPAGAGKSTIAKTLAKALEFIYIDTGAMYRSVALWTIKRNIAADDEEAIKKAINNIDIAISYEKGEQQIFLNGENVTKEIRAEEVGKRASLVSKIACVRKKLVDLQQKLAKQESVIMDGRDIGTKVLPKAFLKIFMTADPEVRAKRRFDELRAKGIDCDYNLILKDIKDRDYEDEHRVLSPLKAAEDALVLDTSYMDINQVVETIMKLFEEKKVE